MDDKVKEVLKVAGEKLQRFRFYLVKQYKRSRRDLRRFLHPKDGGTWKVSLFRSSSLQSQVVTVLPVFAVRAAPGRARRCIDGTWRSLLIFSGRRWALKTRYNNGTSDKASSLLPPPTNCNFLLFNVLCCSLSLMTWEVKIMMSAWK